MSKNVTEIRRLLDEQLHIRGRNLSHQIRRAGRLLPKSVRKDVQYVDQAQALLTHPKLRLMVDEPRVEAAALRVVDFLKTLDPKEQRKTRLLGVAGVVVFNLGIVLALLFLVLAWRGYI